ncbi:MAG: hypothetical protein FJ189_00870 [Gammaproteobacteria bacterium]|nr:hypothetical protein [Gammaproteobacteria bacterium]
MDPAFAGRLLDRLAELTRGNEPRALEYLTMKTAAERQKRLHEKRLAEGIRPLKVWVSDQDYDALQAAYPGPRDGVDWKAVVDAALRKTPASVTVTESATGEVIAYWKPRGVRDTRCQASTARGERCRNDGDMIARWQAPDGSIGEFAVCKTHFAEFKPHGSVLKG